MRLIRRVAATLAMAGIAAIGVRLGGKGGTPRQHGGWTPIDLDELASDRASRSDVWSPAALAAAGVLVDASPTPETVTVAAAPISAVAT